MRVEGVLRHVRQAQRRQAQDGVVGRVAGGCRIRLGRSALRQAQDVVRDDGGAVRSVLVVSIGVPALAGGLSGKVGTRLVSPG